MPTDLATRQPNPAITQRLPAPVSTNIYPRPPTPVYSSTQQPSGKLPPSFGPSLHNKPTHKKSCKYLPTDQCVCVSSTCVYVRWSSCVVFVHRPYLHALLSDLILTGFVPCSSRSPFSRTRKRRLAVPAFPTKFFLRFRRTDGSDRTFIMFFKFLFPSVFVIICLLTLVRSFTTTFRFCVFPQPNTTSTPTKW